MAAGDGEPQGELWPDRCGFLYPASHLWANHLATGPAYLYVRCPAATVGRALVRHNEFWGGRVPPDGGWSAFLCFYGPGHWPGDHDRFGAGGPDFWLFSRMGGRDSLAGDQCVPGIANAATRHPAGSLLA